MLKHKVLLIIPILCTTLNLNGQAYSFINYGIKEGLVQSQTTSLVQDELGYLWIATLGGVSQFDGREFKNFTTKNGLVSNTVHSIYHSHGKVYMGCNGGLSIYDEGEIYSYNLPAHAKEDKIISIIKSRNTVWLGTDNSGLWVMENDSLLNIKDEAIQSIENITEIPDGLLLGTDSGLYTFYTDKRKFEKNYSELEDAFVSDMIKFNDSDLWISTYRNGLFKIEGRNVAKYSEENGLISDRIRKIEMDDHGNVWTVSKKGISKITGNEIQNFTYENGLPTEDLKDVLIDRENNLWLATSSNGILKLANEKVQVYWEDQGLCSAKALSVIVDEDELWIGSYDNGICKMSQGELTNLSEKDGFIHNRVWCGIKSRSDDLWFGTSSGLCKISNEEVINYRQSTGLINDRITSLFEDSDSSIWIGHRQGISKIIRNQITNYSSEQGFIGQRIRSIQRQGERLYLGAENGLFAFDGKAFKQLKDQGVFKQNAVLNITIDEPGNLWLGTKNGLFQYDHETFKRIDFSEVSSADYIVFTNRFENWIIIGTNNGLYFLDSEAYNNSELIVTNHVSLEDGMSSLECNLNSSTIDENGRIYFGTGNGTVTFLVKELLDVSTDIPPTVHIEGLRIFMEDLDHSQYLSKEFKSDQNHVTIDFTGIDLSHPNDISYEYRLNGLEDEFLRSDDIGSISYPYLPHGEYNFEVYAISKSGVRSVSPALISFTILPPFYLTNWFLILVCLATIGVIALILIWRRNIRRRKLDNERLVYQSKILELEQQSLNSSMNRHFIFNALNSIQYYINRQDKLAANKYLSNFAKLIRKNLDSSQENLTLLSNELERINLYLSLEHMRFQDKFDYEVTIDPSINPEQVKLPSMLLQPFLENSIWHGILPNDKRGKLKINVVRNTDSSIKIIIDDNGIGVKQSLSMKNGKHNSHDSKGVSLTNDRIILYQKLTHENFKIKGPFELLDDGDRVLGTRVEVYIPDNQAFERIIKEANKLGKLSLNY